jgi:Fic family protein
MSSDMTEQNGREGLDGLLGSLTEKLMELNSHRPLGAWDLQQLLANKRVEHVWSSNAIEGNSLTEGETRVILETGVTVGQVPVKDVFEVVDLSKAFDYMMQVAQDKGDITIPMIQEFNRMVTLNTMHLHKNAIPGDYRAAMAYPYGIPDVHYSSPDDIPEQMEELIVWSRTAEGTLHPVEFAAQLHWRFTTIHPFMDGNGRTARLLMDLSLVKAGYPLVNIQPGEKARTEYIHSLSESNRRNNPEPFTRVVVGYVDKELDFMIHTVQLAERNQRDYDEYLKNSRIQNTD